MDVRFEMAEREGSGKGPQEYVEVVVDHAQVVRRPATPADIERFKVQYAEFKGGTPAAPAAPNSVPHEPEVAVLSLPAPLVEAESVPEDEPKRSHRKTK